MGRSCRMLRRTTTNNREQSGSREILPLRFSINSASIFVPLFRIIDRKEIRRKENNVKINAIQIVTESFKCRALIGGELQERKCCVNECANLALQMFGLWDVTKLKGFVLSEIEMILGVGLGGGVCGKLI